VPPAVATPRGTAAGYPPSPYHRMRAEAAGHKARRYKHKSALRGPLYLWYDTNLYCFDVKTK